MFVKYKLYVWQAVNPNGDECHGQIMALNKFSVRNTLRLRGLLVRKIHHELSLNNILKCQPIKNKDLYQFTQQVAVVLKSGFNFLQAVKFASYYHSNYNFRRLLQLIINDLESGMSFSKSISIHRQIFNSLYTALIEVGEGGGDLHNIFVRLTSYLQNLADFQSRVQKLLFYPALLIIVAVVVTVCILLLVMPQFQSLYANFGAELPLASKLLIMLADFLRCYAVFIFALIFAIFIFCYCLYKKFIRCKFFMDNFFLKIPIFGALLHKIILAKFINTLSLAYTAGIPLLASLNHAKLVAKNSLYMDFISKLIIKVSAGVSLQNALVNTNFFPKHLVNILSIGDEISNLEEMLNYLSSLYDTEISNTFTKFSNVLEPLIMLFLGGIVGFLVLAIYYPIINLGAIL